jgi:hypothetical protein
MTQRLFVCHAKSDIESTSEVIDGLETALDFPAGSLLTSSLPGYSSDSRSEDELRAMLAGSSAVLALFTETSVDDPGFNFELGAAWALGLEVLPVLYGATQAQCLPWPVRSNPGANLDEPGAWEQLLVTLAQRLDAPPRRLPDTDDLPPAAATLSGIAPVGSSEDMAPPSAAEHAAPARLGVRAPAPAGFGIAPPPAADAAFTEVAESGFAEVADNGLSELRESWVAEQPALDERELLASAAGSADPPDERELLASAAGSADPPDERELLATATSIAEEISATLAGFDPEPEPVASYRLEAPPTPPAPLPAAIAVSIAPVVSLSEAEPLPALLRAAEPISSSVFARLPTCGMSFEAGRAVSDCAFNRAEVSDLQRELDKPLGHFVDAIGGSWQELRDLQDLDQWMSTTLHLIEHLPAELRRVNDWYLLGFELATLHNLAGQLELDGPDRSDEAEQTWRGALERFLMRAENAQIGYENLGRVLSQLENLAGPRGQRDLGNIRRSLDEVRGYAAGADKMHTAA